MNLELEHQLLLGVLSGEPAASARLNLLGASEWEQLVQQSVRSCVAPLLYRQMKILGSSVDIPPGTLESLRDIYFSNGSRNLRLYKGLEQVLRSMSQNNIPVIVLKGAFLAEAVYPRISLRAMEDIDLLVKAPDLRKVEELLLALGFTGDERNGTAYAQECSHFVYELASKSLLVEIHWNIEGSPSPFRIDVDGLWKRRQQVSIAGVEATSLSPEDLLLHICLHSSFHHLFNGFGLRSLCDIAETLRHYDGQVEWKQLCDRAQQWGAGNCVYLTLHLAKKLLNVSVPDDVLRVLEPNDFDVRFATWAERRIFGEMGGGTGMQSDNWGKLLGSKRLVEKLVILIKTCFPAPKLLAKMYSVSPVSRRVHLYYPVRLWDLVRRHAHQTWLLLTSNEQTRAWVDREINRVEEATIRKQLFQADAGVTSWIAQDAGRRERFAIVKWLASMG